MRNIVIVGVLFLISCGCLFPQDGSSLTPSSTPPGMENRNSTGFASRQLATKEKSEPEEPDFAFIAGGPYTQKAKSTQFISVSQYGWRHTTLGGSTLQHTEFGTLLRNEWGLTDR